MQHRDGDDEGEIEPVGDEDVRFLALDQRHQEHQQISHPDDRQPESAYHSGSAYSLRLRDAEQIAGAGDQDEEIVAEHDEPRRQIAGEPRAAGLLHDIERGRDQHVAAEREDHRRGVQRPQPAEAGPRQVEIERGPGQLRGDQEADGKAGDAPEHRHHGGEFDRTQIVVGPAVDLLRRQRRRTIVIAVHDREGGGEAGGACQRGMKGECRIQRLRRGDKAEKCGRGKDHGQTGFAMRHRFCGLGLGHAWLLFCKCAFPNDHSSASRGLIEVKAGSFCRIFRKASTGPALPKTR